MIFVAQAPPDMSVLEMPEHRKLYLISVLSQYSLVMVAVVKAPPSPDLSVLEMPEHRKLDLISVLSQYSLVMVAVVKVPPSPDLSVLEMPERHHDSMDASLKTNDITTSHLVCSTLG